MNSNSENVNGVTQLARVPGLNADWENQNAWFLNRYLSNNPTLRMAAKAVVRAGGADALRELVEEYAGTPAGRVMIEWALEGTDWKELAAALRQ